MKKKIAIFASIVVAVLSWFFTPNLILSYTNLPLDYEEFLERFSINPEMDYIGGTGHPFSAVEFYDLGLGRELMLQTSITQNWKMVVAEAQVISSSLLGSQKKLPSFEVGSDIKRVEIFKDATLYSDLSPIITIEGATDECAKIISTMQRAKPTASIIKLPIEYSMRMISSDDVESTFFVGERAMEVESVSETPKRTFHFRGESSLCFVIDDIIEDKLLETPPSWIDPNALFKKNTQGSDSIRFTLTDTNYVDIVSSNVIRDEAVIEHFLDLLSLDIIHPSRATHFGGKGLLTVEFLYEEEVMFEFSMRSCRRIRTELYHTDLDILRKKQKPLQDFLLKNCDITLN